MFMGYSNYVFSGSARSKELEHLLRFDYVVFLMHLESLARIHGAIL